MGQDIWHVTEMEFLNLKFKCVHSPLPSDVCQTPYSTHNHRLFSACKRNDRDRIHFDEQIRVRQTKPHFRIAFLVWSDTIPILSRRSTRRFSVALIERARHQRMQHKPSLLHSLQVMSLELEWLLETVSEKSNLMTLFLLALSAISAYLH